MTKTTPILLDRLAGALAVHGVTLKRTHLLQVAAKALGYDNTHTFTAADKADKLTPPAANYLGCGEVAGYGMMEFFGDPEAGVFAVQKYRIDALSGRKDDWILSPVGGVLDISGMRGTQQKIHAAAGTANTEFSVITDESIRHIIATEQCDEDSICNALVFTSEHFEDTFPEGNPLRSAMNEYIEEADHQWNKEGDAAASMEALRNYWNSINATDNGNDLAKVTCGNCDWRGTEGNCNPIDDIEQRVGPGETMPAGECPECGALAHLVDQDTAKTIDANAVAKSLQDIRNDYVSAGARKHRPDDAMELLEYNLQQAEAAMLANDPETAAMAIDKYNSILAILGKDAKSIDPEDPIYLTNGCCEFPHDFGWMFEGSSMKTGLFDDDFYPLTEEEAAFIAEDVVTSADGRMHALTGYSALYRGRKHIMPSIELPVGPEYDAPSYVEVSKTAEDYVAAILPKVQALEGNVLIDSGINSCVVIQILVPFDKIMEIDNQWHETLRWLMVDPRLPGVDENLVRRHEGQNFAVSVEWIGEGEDGDWQPLALRDHPLLRYDAQRKTEDSDDVDDQWEDLNDGSYCISVPAYAPDDVLEALPRYLVARLDAEGGAYPKRLLEELSWTDIATIQEFIANEKKAQ